MIPLALRSLVALGLLALCLESAFARPSADTVRRAAASVVRVTAEGCPGAQGARVGSGFVWPDQAQIVTALHVVADCAQVTVEYVDAGVQRRGRTHKVLRRADLALLLIDNPPAVPALSATATAADGEELVAIGLPLNVTTWQETYGTRALNVRRLNDILNEVAREQIRRLGAPAVDLEIFRLTAVVKPGSSGGPIINVQGAVVGVVDGGLDGGNASLNWAVPADFLKQLAASSEQTGNIGLGPQAATVFSFSGLEPPAGTAPLGEDLICGGRSYFYLATRTLDEIVGSLQHPGALDDPNGFMLLLNNFSQVVPPPVLARLRFDLLVDSETGATIAVPDTMDLIDTGGFCVAEARYSNIDLIFSGHFFDPFATNLQSVAINFNYAVSQALEIVACQPDPNWAEPVPHFRFDGLVAQRSGVFCLDAVTGQQIYGFFGNMGRENAFAGIVALNADTFRVGPAGDPEATLDWVAAALAVLISTFQI